MAVPTSHATEARMDTAMIGQIQRFLRRKTLVACREPESDDRAHVIFAAERDPAIEAAGEDLRNRRSGFTNTAPGRLTDDQGMVQPHAGRTIPNSYNASLVQS